MGRSLTAPVTRWAVTWTYPDMTGNQIATCALQEGYTNMASFPAMIAIRRGLDARLIDIRKIERLPDEI